MNETQVKNFRNLIRALKEGKAENFSMEDYARSCKTPACVLGHYASRRDLQTLLCIRMSPDIDKPWIFFKGTGTTADYSANTVLEHFGITWLEAAELFSVRGCGRAKTKTAALKYLRSFLERKLAK